MNHHGKIIGLKVMNSKILWAGSIKKIYQASEAKNRTPSAQLCMCILLRVYNARLSNIITQLDFWEWVAGLKKTPHCFLCHKSTRLVCDKP